MESSDKSKSTTQHAELKLETQQQPLTTTKIKTEESEEENNRKGKKAGKRKSRSPSPVALTKSHCTCCHVCHVSMKQRPRPVLSCSTCNIIMCKTCLEEKWPTSQWIENPGKDWSCHKCKGTCTCKACKARKVKPRETSNYVAFSGTGSLDLLTEFTVEEGHHVIERPRKRKQKENHSASSASSDEELSEEEGVSKRAKQRLEAQDTFQKQKQQHQESLSLIGLGANVFNSCSTDEAKLMGLMQRKERCGQVMCQMNKLLSFVNNEYNLISNEISRLSSTSPNTSPDSSRPSLPSIEEFPPKRSSLIRVGEFPLL